MQDCLVEVGWVKANMELLSTFGVLRLYIHIALDPWDGLGDRH